MNHGTCRHDHQVEGANVHRPSKGHHRGFPMCKACHLAMDELDRSQLTAKRIKKLADAKLTELLGGQS